MESQLRTTVPNDGGIHVGHEAAMDLVPYQLDPARQALARPRQRILIADAVGLGKTLEAGILVSELIARGRARRILVLAVKSMLTQFQKEFWNRFTIPLTRLDSIGIQRVRSRIPTNHNPFYYYDKAIISIDTLKQDAEYRTYLEQAYWDVIVIDEAHNVADRGTGSLRSRLARLLARRSDTLIMLSATPHDGRARSFASLVNMLDATAITDPDAYTEGGFSRQGAGGPPVQEGHPAPGSGRVSGPRGLPPQVFRVASGGSRVRRAARGEGRGSARDRRAGSRRERRVDVPRRNRVGASRVSRVRRHRPAA